MLNRGCAGCDVQTFKEMLRTISEVARLSSNTLLRICKFPQKFFHWRCLKCEIGLLQKASFKTTIFFSKKYTNKFIENVRQYVTKATFSETTEDRGQKHI